jgi:hypothetical protein
MRNYLAETRTVTAIQPISLNGATSTSVIIDRANFSIAKFVVQFGAVAGDITSITVQSSPNSNFSGTPVDRFEANAAAITAAEAGAAVIGVDADIRNWERYVRIVVVKASSAAVLSASVTLGHAHQSPTTATGQGYSALLTEPA